MNPTLLRVTQRIIERSKETRSAYLARIEQAKSNTVHRSQLACGNLAHGFAACQPDDKASLKSMLRNNIAIITSYNDMLSAHQPYEVYPTIIRKALHSVNAVGQVAGGVPAMCDGVTQGQDGMELSLLSREVIAMSAAVGLSHNMFDGALYLGVCDKIVPGLVMAALSFGHLPAIFVPSGPMASGLPNKEKVRIRQLYAEGKQTVRRCWRRKPRPTMRRGPVRSTVRLTLTRWWWSLWGCSFRARPLSSRMHRCARR
jgi:phosphogluconate dehydratase